MDDTRWEEEPQGGTAAGLDGLAPPVFPGLRFPSPGFLNSLRMRAMKDKFFGTAQQTALLALAAALLTLGMVPNALQASPPASRPVQGSASSAFAPEQPAEPLWLSVTFKPACVEPCTTSPYTDYAFDGPTDGCPPGYPGYRQKCTYTYTRYDCTNGYYYAQPNSSCSTACGSPTSPVFPSGTCRP